MNRYSTGFIFLMTLCILGIISLLLMAWMHHLLLFVKVIEQKEMKHQKFYQLEYLAVHITSTSSEDRNKSCVQVSDLPNQIIPLLRQNRGCHLSVGKSNYSYLIEDLGDYPCQVLKFEAPNRATHHIRISIIELNDDETLSTGLQLRLIKPGNIKECIGVRHKIRAGISSWRYLPTLD